MDHTKCIYFMALTILVFVSCKDTSVATDGNDVNDSTYGLSIDSNYYLELSTRGSINVSEKEKNIYQMLIVPTVIDSEIILISNRVVVKNELELRINPDSLDQVEAYNDYLNKNAKDTLLTDYNLGLKIEYLYLNNREISESYGSYNFWDVFRLKYPKSSGLYSTSQIGFNSDSTTAVVGLGYSCGGLCGGYTVQVLKLQNSEWIVFKFLHNVVS